MPATNPQQEIHEGLVQPLLDPKTLSSLPSAFRPRPVELLHPHRGESPEREPADIILDEIQNLVSPAIREQDARPIRDELAALMDGIDR